MLSDPYNQSILFQKGTPVYIEAGKHYEEWLINDVIESDFEKCWKVRLYREQETHEITLPYSKRLEDFVFLRPYNDDALDKDDLIELETLNTPCLLASLQSRWGQGKIYTAIGPLLVALNPCQKLPHLYSNEVMKRYARSSTFVPSSESYPDQGATLALPPHIFGLVQKVYCATDIGRMNQLFLISGDSGSGKTSTVNFIIDYLSSISSTSNSPNSIKSLLAAINPIFEAFGNAKTSLNPNSSRFGRYIELRFSGKGSEIELASASISPFLLERTRIVSPPRSEGNYHILQYLLHSPSDIRQLCGILETTSWNFIPDPSSSPSYVSAFQRVQQCFYKIGLSETQQGALFQLLAVVLHLGNVHMASIPTLQSRPDSSIAMKSAYHLDMIACMLQMDSKILETYLTMKTVKTKNEEIRRPLSVIEGANVRDAMAKFIYERVFQWLANYTSSQLGKDGTDDGASRIGIIDIYGFEHFEANSFEQLMINYANEKIHGIFNDLIFKLHQDEYLAEGIPVEIVDFDSNDYCLELIEGSLGILDLLNEETKLRSGTDESFLTKLSLYHGRPAKFASPSVASRRRSLMNPPPSSNSLPTTPKRLSVPISSPSLDLNSLSSPKTPRRTSSSSLLTDTLKQTFIINHYARPVTYTVTDFIHKNRDLVAEDVEELLNHMVNDTMKEMLGLKASAPQIVRKDSVLDSEVAITKSKLITNKSSRSTLAYKFKSSLSNLLQIISNSQPHFIRCIKPNLSLKPGVFDSRYVADQLRSAGILQTVKLARQGILSNNGKYLKSEFVRRFRCLCNSWESEVESEESFRLFLLALKLKENECKIGRTKIFLSPEKAAILEHLRSRILDCSATRIQSWYRSKRCRRTFLVTRSLIIRVQAIIRRRLVERKAELQKRSCVRIQSVWRGYRERKRYKNRLKSIVLFQSAVRGYLARSATRVKIKLIAEPKLNEEEKMEEVRSKENHVLMPTVPSRNLSNRTRTSAQSKRRRNRELYIPHNSYSLRSLAGYASELFLFQGEYWSRRSFVSLVTWCFLGYRLVKGIANS